MNLEEIEIKLNMMENVLKKKKNVKKDVIMIRNLHVVKVVDNILIIIVEHTVKDIMVIR